MIAFALLALAGLAFIVSALATLLLVRIGTRAGTLDTPGVENQVKRSLRGVPNIGGIGIVLGIVMALLAAYGLAASRSVPAELLPPALSDGIVSESGPAAIVLAGLLVVHALGLIDDRRPLPWAPKLAVMLAVPVLVSWLGDTRVLTALDVRVGGAWLSIVITAVWFALVMNAINFMDNMDGLAGGTACLIAAAISGVALKQEQWFVAGAAACVAGSSLGFLPLNFPRARIFMGDGGSLVLGFALAFLTTRLTYLDSTINEPRWDRIIIPFVLLAVPLYDLLSVVTIRLSQGRSPFVGDLQHISHRFEGRGLSRPQVAVAVWTLTLIAGLGAVIVTDGTPFQSAVVACQTIGALMLLAVVERGMPWRDE
ncbi:MAG: MraY family glycosyltransferase [Planctomycetota bacterium]